MEFSDEGYIIRIRKHGEKGLILTVLSAHNGKIIGYVKNGMSKKYFGICQLGNKISVNGYTRLEENMYRFQVDLIKSYAVEFMTDNQKLAALSSFCELSSACMVEKDNLGLFYKRVEDFFNFIHEDNWITYYTYFEFYLLEYLGIGLDLSECAVTGSRENLQYVSPKSGKAVCEEIGKAYQNRLYRYPHYIMEQRKNPSLEEIKEVLKLTEFFLNKNFFRIHGLKFPENRATLLNKLEL